MTKEELERIKQGYQPIHSKNASVIPPNTGSHVRMKENGYIWKDLDKAWWEGFDNAKNKMEKRIAELEKENEELKKQQFTLRNERNTFLAQNEQYEKDLIDFNDNLTKAKETIKELSKSLYLAKGIVRDLIDDTVDYKESKARAMYCYEQEKFDAYKVAEQFLKEVSE